MMGRRGPGPWHRDGVEMGAITEDRIAHEDGVTVIIHVPEVMVQEVGIAYLDAEARGRIAVLAVRRALLELRGLIDRKIDEVEKGARR